ncbi:excisionase family DNA binding protein [Nocardiopsis mwathae]|uniref:Excisionase family DNA binding protein n=1 Tax=Nocardiopsis mwathae TaxID=1472723 RepID=A0A7W9YMW8_9ACTN|nr:helix-turn-helix domain-containing protein [Nocardiopsis mwathae]MBB6174982.1 excisionase family DNA binding protein [Nocardiopsis mwathae]
MNDSIPGHAGGSRRAQAEKPYFGVVRVDGRSYHFFGPGRHAPVYVHSEGKGSQWLLTVDDTARELNVSRRTVYELITRGELASVQIRRCRRVAMSAILDYLDRRSAGPVPRRDGDGCGGAHRT